MPNRLAREASPYLRQHADNPVDWYPWGPEALSLAQSENKPILISIGYSSCHWCHVMERESFDDPAVAALMNDGFVNIKVDREERPDVDSLYMRAVQSMGARGGWPLTVFLTPDGRPFYGGTYFPPEARHGLPSFRQVLAGIRKAWEEDSANVGSHAEQLREALTRSMLPPEGGSRDILELDDLIEGSIRTLVAQIDPVHGGMGPAPKFPQPVVLDFLLHWSASPDDEGDPSESAKALECASLTLERMAKGGIRDHLGGGFHRYSVDERWLVPHFEKMLYDNALLLGTYLNAYHLGGDPLFREVCLEIGDYLLTDLREATGGFRAARDADSEGEEGRFYVWTPDQVHAVLGAEEGHLFSRAYDVSPSGNFEGSSILHLPHDLNAVARSEGISRESLETRLSAARKLLLEARAEREEPYLDEKVLTGWNGLAIRALARAGATLGRSDWVEAADRAARFILNRHREGEALTRYSMAGEARGVAFLEDYGAMGLACLALHQATLDPEWFHRAKELAGMIPNRFLDAASGLLFDAPTDMDDLVVRPRDPSDNAVPSGSSLAVELLLRVGRLVERDEWVEIAQRTVQAEASGMLRFPGGYGRMLVNADLAHHPPEVLVLAGDPSDPAMAELHRAALRSHHPRVTVVAGGLTEVAEAQDKPSVDGRPTAYLCRGYTCLPPIQDAGALQAAL